MNRSDELSLINRLSSATRAASTNDDGSDDDDEDDDTGVNDIACGSGGSRVGGGDDIWSAREQLNIA